VASGDYDDYKREFMRIVRAEAEPYSADGWKVGGSGLRRLDATGHWAHFWFYSSRGTPPLTMQATAGTVSPYLLSVFNRQRVDRPPSQNFIAVHSLLMRPVEWLRFTPGLEADDEPIHHPLHPGVALTTTTLQQWLRDRFAALLPKLVALSSDEALLAWLSDPARSPTSHDLRYAALLAYHLRRDGELESILQRADEARRTEDIAAVERGINLGYRSDRQATYPQDWSHARFLEYLRACPRDLR
jgi:hypothetical protein